MFTVSVTERQNFRRCKRMWRYSSFSQMSLTRLVTKKALSLGTLVHNALADWLVNPQENLVSLYMKHALVELDRIKEVYRTQVGSEISDSELESFFDAASLGRDMMENYQNFWKKPLPDGFEIVAPEQKVNVEVSRDEDDEPIIFEGKFDGLIQNEKGHIYILEHKTYGQRPRIESLNTNDQFLSYIWLAQRLDIGRIGGIAYDGMWKRNNPPRGSTIKDLFMRTELQRNRAELREFELNLLYEIQDMKNLAAQITNGNVNAAYPNHPWQGCWDCQFVPLCNAESQDEDTDFIKNNLYSLRAKDEEVEE